MSDRAPDGVLICGAYGTGKSSAAEEIAARLDAEVVPYAAIDLDWLWWFDTGTDDPDADERLGLANVSDVVENYLASGIRRFVFAGWLADQRELTAFRAVLAFPLTVVELNAPLGTIDLPAQQSANLTPPLPTFVTAGFVADDEPQPQVEEQPKPIEPVPVVSTSRHRKASTPARVV